MLHNHDKRTQMVILPGAAVDNTTANATVIDRVVNGITHDAVDVYIALGATDIAMTALKLEHSDQSGAGFVAMDGAFGTAGAPALPTATDDNALYAFHVDARAVKRYIRLVATFGDGAVGGYVVAWADLSRGHEAPYTAAGRGLTAEVFIN